VPCHKSDSVSCVSHITEGGMLLVLTRSDMGCQLVVDYWTKNLIDDVCLSGVVSNHCI